MNQISNQKNLDDYESSGPRPPVPGQESRIYKMTEARISESSRFSPPSFCKWNQKLTYLLEDAQGAEIFKRFVEGEGGVHVDRLNFYFACEGLKQQSEDSKIKQMVRAIYKFLRKSQLSIADDLRVKIKAGLNDGRLDSNIFDQMQQDILRIIEESLYPMFLQSDLYIQHIDQASQSAAIITTSTSSSSGSCSVNLPSSSTLPTLHEDTELSISDHMLTVTGDEQPHVRLTRHMLLATQERRLELRPQGAHGYISKISSSYNPVSRQDSERQSCSSGGITDSDTVSMSSSRDGRSQYRRQNESKSIQQSAQLNKETNSIVQVPRTHRASESFRPPNQMELMKQLIPKLEAIQRDQETKEKLDQLINEDANPPVDFRSRRQGQALTDAILRKLQVDDDNDQSILDQHVSRVWSDLTPHRSPGTASPCPDILRRRTHDAGITEDIACSLGGHSMRHSRSMPEHASSSRRLTHKWSSMNTDSGISVHSLEPPIKGRDVTSRSRSIGIDVVEEASRRLLDESTRKTRRYSQYPHMSQQQSPLPPAPPTHTHLSSSHDWTIAVYTFLDEDLPYRSKLPGTQPTLKQFKDYLPKKGNFRFFFKTACEDPDNPVIQEEIVNDTEILPLFEGKVMGLVKPYE